MKNEIEKTQNSGGLTQEVTTVEYKIIGESSRLVDFTNIEAAEKFVKEILYDGESAVIWAKILKNS